VTQAVGYLPALSIGQERKRLMRPAGCNTCLRPPQRPSPNKIGLDQHSSFDRLRPATRKSASSGYAKESADAARPAAVRISREFGAKCTVSKARPRIPRQLADAPLPFHKYARVSNRGARTFACSVHTHVYASFRCLDTSAYS
jgi:hypothetical protein